LNGPIVVGTDGSETATKALAEAIRLAGLLKEPLHVVSVYKPITGQGTVPTEFQASVSPTSEVESVLADAVARARVGGVEATSHARTGDPAAVLLDVADEIGAGLVVVGNKGIGSAKRFVLGNVPGKVVHHSPCSTLVVHTG
jgi:nucleotide-binding universal stress UspA family protein